jgi:hypothetical protein
LCSSIANLTSAHFSSLNIWQPPEQFYIPDHPHDHLKSTIAVLSADMLDLTIVRDSSRAQSSSFIDDVDAEDIVFDCRLMTSHQAVKIWSRNRQLRAVVDMLLVLNTFEWDLLRILTINAKDESPIRILRIFRL